MISAAKPVVNYFAPFYEMKNKLARYVAEIFLRKSSTQRLRRNKNDDLVKITLSRREGIKGKRITNVAKVYFFLIPTLPFRRWGIFDF
jgi:hypothetical protein